MIFIDNKYTRWYYNIITKAQSRILPADVYTEKHHVIPKSLGGNNSIGNLVALTAKEHFLCHWLLTKMTTNNDKRSMVFALRMLKAASSKHQRYNSPITAKVYETIRKEHAEYMSKTLKGRFVSHETRQKMSIAAKNKSQNSFKGKSHTAETKEAIRNANRGKKRTPEQKERMSAALRNMPNSRREKLSEYKKNNPLSEESLNKIRKKYIVTTPNGDEIFTNNLNLFCKHHNLSVPAMRDNVAKGKQDNHKGYRIRPILVP